MFYADQEGLDRVLSRVQEFAGKPDGDPGFWRPAPLLERLAREGRSFTESRSPSS
jgi:3-hydroxyacyl-CoA dehydrogenase